jgi:hypothetical protein
MKDGINKARHSWQNDDKSNSNKQVSNKLEIIQFILVHVKGHKSISSKSYNQKPLTPSMTTPPWYSLLKCVIIVIRKRLTSGSSKLSLVPVKITSSKNKDQKPN